MFVGFMARMASVSTEPGAGCPPARLPRGRHHLERAAVRASQRQRMLDGITSCVAERGYASTTVADVIATAGVSRRTFYEHFPDKEGCYLAAYEESVSATLEAVAQGISGAEDWLSRVRGSLRAYLKRVVDNPQAARAFIVEVLAAGERACEQRDRVHRRFSDFLRAARVQAGQELELPELPDEVFEVMVGGIEHVVAHEIRSGRADRLMALEQPLLYFQISVFAGHAHATAAMQCGSDGAR